MSSKNENRVSSVSRIDATENPTLRANSNNVQRHDKGKYFYESKESVPYDQLISNSRGNEYASNSYVDQPCPNCFTEKETASMVAFKGIKIAAWMEILLKSVKGSVIRVVCLLVVMENLCWMKRWFKIMSMKLIFLILSLVLLQWFLIHP